VYHLENDQLNTLVEIIREQSRDTLSRADFNDRMLQLFEDIAGFEKLPRKLAQRYLKILWQSYQSDHRAPERSVRNRH
jgi:hypothetical protein